MADVEGQTKPDPRLRVPDVEIDDGTPDDSVVAFLDVSILDSTGAQPYRGDVLVRGKRIVSVGSTFHNWRNGLIT